jgi:membrane protein involved in colicin uptake
MNDVVAVLAEIRAENDEDRATKAAAAKIAAEERDRKKSEKEAKAAEKKADLLPELTTWLRPLNRMNQSSLVSISHASKKS